MLMASLQDEAITVLMRLPEDPTYSEVVDALAKRFPGISSEEHRAAFQSATRPWERMSDPFLISLRISTIRHTRP